MKLKVIFLSLLMMVVAGAARADMLFPISSTWSAIYNSWAGTTPPNFWTWTYSMTASGPAQPFNGIDFFQVAAFNYGNSGETNNFYIGSSDTAVYVSDLTIMFPFFEIGNVGHSWQHTFPGDTTPTTYTILATSYPYTILSSGITNYDAYLVKETYVGKATGSSTFMYHVWLPGVGEIADFDFGAVFPPQYDILNGYSVPLPVPVPPSLVLLASGLVCLVGWRRRSRL